MAGDMQQGRSGLTLAERSALARRQLGVIRRPSSPYPTALGSAAGAAASAVPGVAQVKDWLQQWTPSDLLETWAKAIGQASGDYLHSVGTTAAALGKPDLSASWWVSQYAVSEGLALVVFAFVLVFIKARRPGGSAAARRRCPGGVPGAADDAGAGRARAAGGAGLRPRRRLQHRRRQRRQHRHHRLRVRAGRDRRGAGHPRRRRQPAAHRRRGGAVALLLVIELLAAGFGVYLGGLLVPFALAQWVYPPARTALSRVLGTLGGPLVPVAAFLGFDVPLALCEQHAGTAAPGYLSATVEIVGGGDGLREVGQVNAAGARIGCG